MLRAPEGMIGELVAALADLQEQVHQCDVCSNVTIQNPCVICSDPTRDVRVVLVVEQPQDVTAFERVGEYKGRYAVLHGSLSPLDGVGPEQLKIRPLLERLRDGVVEEVILATDPDVEGDATALYLARLLQPVGLRVTRLARGIAVGTEIEYADAASLARALEYRRDMGAQR